MALVKEGVTCDPVQAGFSVFSRLDSMRRRIEDHFTGSSHRDLILRLLNEALSGTIVFMLLYQRQHYLWPDELSAHLYRMSREKFELADAIGARIAQLGENPDYSEERMLACCRSYLPAKPRDPIWLHDTLAAERDSAQIWASVLDRVGDEDPSSKSLIRSTHEFARRHAKTLEALVNLPEAKPLGAGERGEGLPSWVGRLRAASNGSARKSILEPTQGLALFPSEYRDG